MMLGRWVGLVVVMVGLMVGNEVGRLPSSVSAQGPEQPIYVGSGITNVKWSEDSSSLVFQEPFNSDYGVFTPEHDTWFQFFVGSRQVIRTNSWPLQPPLTLAQRQRFEIATASFIFASPDKRYLVYVAEPLGWDNPVQRPLAIADLQTNQHKIIWDILVQGMSSFLFDYHVLWSGNSRVFFVVGGGYGGQRQPFYISNFAPNLNTLTIQPIVEGLAFGGETIYPQRIFDLSDNGGQILLEDLRPDYTTRLFLWDVNDLSVSKLIPTTTYVVEAAFKPDNEQMVLFVDEDGLKRHDLNANTTTLLDVTANPSWADGGIWISPDIQYIALYDSDVGGRDWLYVVPISDLPIVTPMPTIQR